MKLFKAGFDGEPCFENSKWVGFIFNCGLNIIDAWLMGLLTLPEMSPGGVDCYNLHQEISHIYDKPEELWTMPHMVIQNDFDKNDYHQYGDFYFGHFLTNKNRSWRLIVPFLDEENGITYGMWAGELKHWKVLEPYFKSLPEEEIEYLNKNDKNLVTMAQEFVFYKDNEAIPRNVISSFRYAKFVGDN